MTCTKSTLNLDRIKDMIYDHYYEWCDVDFIDLYMYTDIAFKLYIDHNYTMKKAIERSVKIVFNNEASKYIDASDYDEEELLEKYYKVYCDKELHDVDDVRKQEIIDDAVYDYFSTSMCEREAIDNQIKIYKMER